MTTPLSIELMHERDRCVVRAVGEVDYSNADRLVEIGIRAVRSPQPMPVVDLAGVSFCDSVGISALVQIRGVAAVEGKTLRLVNVSNRIAHTMKLLNLDALLGVTAGADGSG